VEELGETAAAVITFAGRLEEDSSEFYQRLADGFPSHKELFLGFVKDGKKNKILLVRTYQETVTDALETGYSFKGLDLAASMPHVRWQQEMGLSEGVRSAVELEKQAVDFYKELTRRSDTLLSTITAAFSAIAKNRASRLPKLESISP